MKREILELTSRIIKRMLLKQSKEREITSLHFYEFRPDVMKEFCLYAIYSYEFRYKWKPKFWLYENASDPYHNYKATREKIGGKWEYEFPKHLAYELYMLANFLMC
ncbi:hypothetical protein O3M35_009970 [Rhynocoris fuscipes]|uniref:Uncharacterized protein n=1 Tax=Rhynocoris fuscipes TaxID=488301 RepID=A0AAW1D4Z6_9HEMI